VLFLPGAPAFGWKYILEGLLPGNL